MDPPSGSIRRRVIPRRGLNGSDKPPLVAGRGTIDLFPDDVLFDIFHFLRVDGMGELGVTWEWETLVHVCRRWRHLIFASPLRLDLRLLCTRKTPAQLMLDIWPAIPIIISDRTTSHFPISNVIAALEHHDLVFGIWLGGLASYNLELFAAKTRRRFPALMFLMLHSYVESVPAPPLPLEFLGGFSPRLRIVQLSGIPFPALPHLLLSTTDLVDLDIWNIPIHGYVSPGAMVAGLSALAHLESLAIGFVSPKSPSDLTIRFPQPRRRITLSALTKFRFRGVSDYLEDFLPRIHTPSLCTVDITLFNQLVFHIPQLAQFANRTENFRSFDQAEVVLGTNEITHTLIFGSEVYFRLRVSCNELDLQVSSLAQVCSQLYRLLSKVERLDVRKMSPSQPHWQDDMDATQWLELFEPFTAANTLGLAEEMGSFVSLALKDLGEERAITVLPALREILVEGLQQSSPTQKRMEPFLATRRRLDLPVTLKDWER